jgi:hypothetical protein
VEAERRARAKKEARRPDSGRRAEQSQTRTARRSLEQAEARVHALESREAELNRLLADTTLYEASDGAARATGLGDELERIRAEFGVAFAAWEQAAEEMERLGG